MNTWHAQVYLNSFQENHPKFAGNPLTNKMHCEGQSMLSSWKKYQGSCQRSLLTKRSCSFSSETMTALQEKHPPTPTDHNLPLPPEETIHQSRTGSRRDISKAIDSSKPGLAARPYGVRPGHLKPLVAKSV